MTAAGQIAETACTNHVGYGCNILGVMNEKGQGRTVSLSTSRTAYLKGCTLQNSTSCHHLGRFLQGGIGGVKDEAAARVAYSPSCSLGTSEGCTNVILMYQAGQGGPINLRAAYELAERNCVNGQPSVICHLLGHALYFGKGTAENAGNRTRGRALMMAACTAGVAQSCAVLRTIL